MCGIAGLFQFGGPNGGSVVDTMLSTMVHRGPDAGGAWTDARGRCVLGHRRLSIIDTSDAGRQPMANASGRWVITFNGEIYNFAEVRDALAAAGVHVRGRTDTEVLLESIALWGLDALQKLDGMFAFAAFDTASGELLLARDPFGEKPLYYTELPGGGLAFASELQALQQVPGFDATVSVDAMAEVLMFQYIGAPRTIYASVRKLPPGHWLSVRAGEPPRLGRYYEFRPGSSGFDHRPLADLADELEDILARSIRRRLIADVPLGAFLSGGVDSSTVCALVRRKLGLPLKTFSIGFHDAPESEHEAARAFAAHLGTEHHDQILTPHTSEFLLGIGRLLDEPNADSSCMPTYLLSAFAREQVTVALSGDGGDEMFAGYGRYFLTLDEHAAGRGNPGRSYYSDRILVSTEKHIEELFGAVPSGLAAHLAELRGEIDLSSAPLFCRLRKTDVDNYMPGAVLPKVDRMSMQHSLEVRTPFLNVELARFAEKLPLDVLYRNGRGKLLLREIAYRYLPRDLIDAPKKGFGIPMSRWGREPLLQVASSLLENDDSRLRDALGSAAIDRFMKRQRRMGGFSTYQVWSIAMLESWLRHHPARVPAVVSTPGSGACRLAWPLGASRYVVVDDVTLPLDQPAAMDDPATSAVLGHAVTLALATGDLPGVGASKGSTLALSEWSEVRAESEAGRALHGATLLFPESEASQAVDSEQLRHFRRLGVTRLVFVHPHDDCGPLLSLVLRKKNPLRRLLDAWHLYRRRAATISTTRWRLPSTVRAIPMGASPLSYVASGIDGVARVADTELATSYMLFERLTQLPPIPVGHADIQTKGKGRYSVWEQQCIFAPSDGARGPYWLVPRDEATEAHLDIVPTLLDPGPRDREAWVEAVGRYVRRKAHAAACEPLKPGDTIVVLTHALPPGGAERQWCYLARGLQRAGYRVVFMVTEQLRGANAHYLPLLQSENLPVIDIWSQPLREVNERLAGDAEAAGLLAGAGSPLDATLAFLASALKSVGPRAVIAQLDAINVMAGIAAHVADVPCAVLSFRNYNPSHFSYLSNDWFLPLYRILEESPRVLLSGNSRGGNDDYAAWIGIPPHRVAFIPNAADPQAITPCSAEALDALRTELGVSPDQPIVLGVFRLSEEKRPLDFVEVCARIAARLGRIRAFIVGIGPLQEKIALDVEARGLRESVTLLGRRNDIPALMQLAAVLLLTSSHEGMPNVVMEAQLAGLPVVGTAVGGTTDLIVDGVTGHLCGVGDVACLAERCVQVVTSGKVRSALSQAARERLLEEFGVDALAARHVELMERGGGAASRSARPDEAAVPECVSRR